MERKKEIHHQGKSMGTWRLNLDDRSILIDDDVFEVELDELHQYACHEAPYVPAQYDNRNIKEQRPLWINRFPLELILQSPVWNKLKEYLTKEFNCSNIVLHESYLLASQPGDVHYYHTDGGPKNSGRAMTTVTYLNKDWDINWAGETMFENEGEIVKAVIPKYGRTIVFDHSINHSTKPPSINCLERRFVLVNKIELEL